MPPAEPPLVIAHRGDRARAPENTLAAFEAALEAGVDGIELDVRMTRDGVPVVLHDASLLEAPGRRRSLSSLRLEEIRPAPSPPRFSGRFREEPIPLLEEVLSRFGPETRLCIEIKTERRGAFSGADRGLTDRVVDLIREQVPPARGDRLFLLSFRPEVLLRARERDPGIRAVLNLPEPDPKAFREKEAIFGVTLPLSRLSRGFSEAVRASGLALWTYTCNRPTQLARALDCGVDGLLTDDPGWLVGVLGGNRAPGRPGAG